MQSRCEATGSNFDISAEELELYTQFGLPAPRLSAVERFRRQLAFRSAGRFFWRECSASGKKIFSAYSPHVGFPIVEPDHYNEDHARLATTGMSFDAQGDFFGQVSQLWQVVPRAATTGQNVENCQATHDCFDCQDCFFIFDCHRTVGSSYSIGLRACQNCLDCLRCADCRDCYECIGCYDSSRLRWSISCRDCSESWFLRNCKDCRDCLLCEDLEGQRYCVLNQQLSAVEYEKALAHWNLSNRELMQLAKSKFAEISQERPAALDQFDSLRVRRGGFIHKSEDVFRAFDCSHVRRVAYCCYLSHAEDCLEGAGFGEDLASAAQFVGVGYGARDIVNCVSCYGNVEDLTYCFHCSESAHLLGCVGLRGSQYCILNKQHSKEEFELLRTKIVQQMQRRKQWGLFFSTNFSEFAYNISAAAEMFNLNKIQCDMLGYSWDDEEDIVRPSQLLSGGIGSEAQYAELPAVLLEGELEAMTQKVYLCEITGRPYRFTERELKLYRSLGVPPPSRCFEQRHRERIAHRVFSVV